MIPVNEAAENMMATTAAAEYLERIGKLNDTRMERWWRENSGNVYSLNAFIEAVYTQAGHDV